MRDSKILVLVVSIMVTFFIFALVVPAAAKDKATSSTTKVQVEKGKKTVKPKKDVKTVKKTKKVRKKTKKAKKATKKKSAKADKKKVTSEKSARSKVKKTSTEKTRKIKKKKTKKSPATSKKEVKSSVKKDKARNTTAAKRKSSNKRSRAASKGKAVRRQKVNINKADIETLSTLEGIGPERAKAIVQYRKKHGPFKKGEDIKQVHGIGDIIFENNKRYLTVK